MDDQFIMGVLLREGFHLLYSYLQPLFFLTAGTVSCLKLGLHSYIYLIPVCSLKREGVRPVSSFGLFRVNLLAMTTNFTASNSPHGGLIMKVYGTLSPKLKKSGYNHCGVCFIMSGSLPHQWFFLFFSWDTGGMLQ